MTCMNVDSAVVSRYISSLNDYPKVCAKIMSEISRKFAALVAANWPVRQQHNAGAPPSGKRNPLKLLNRDFWEGRWQVLWPRGKRKPPPKILFLAQIIAVWSYTYSVRSLAPFQVRFLVELFDFALLSYHKNRSHWTFPRALGNPGSPSGSQQPPCACLRSHVYRYAL